MGRIGVRQYILLAILGIIASIVAVYVVQITILTEAAPGINKTINFQGKMTDDDGLNVANGTYEFVFQMYTVASGGSATWTETVNLDVVDGIFHHQLGSTTALPGSVDFNTDNIFLGITFNSDPDGEMTPRIQLTATPYAFNADQLDGLDASDFVQLSPSTAQTGDIAITGSVSAGSAVFASDSTAALDVQTDVGDSVFRVDTTGTYPKVVFGDGIGTTLYNTSDWDLATGGNFYISDGSSAQVAIGDTGSGAAGIRFGSGLDTSLYRSGVAQLTLSGSFLTTGSTTLGDDASDALTITGTAVAIPNSLNFDSSTLFIDAANNRVGIGTAAPAETITVNGNFLVRDADTTTKAYRFRTSGYSLDIETAGQSLYISTFTNADFSGPQYVKLMFPENSNETQALGTWNFRTNPWDTIRHTIDAGASGNVVFNQNGAATDFTVQGDTVANLLFVDGSADSVTIGGQLVLTTVSGAGLTDCDGTNDKLVWDSSAMTFGCGIDGSGGVGAGIVGIGTINSATKHANGAVINGSDELIMQTADASFPGLVSTGTQTFGGNKTFNGTLTVSAAAPNSPLGASSVVNGNLTSTTNNQTAFFANPTIAPGSASSRVYSGILASPTSSSTNMASGSIYGVAGSVETTGTGTFGITAALFGQNSINSGTTATANAGVAVYNPNGTGSIGNNYGMFIQNQTRGTNDYALYIEGADTYALWVDAGASRLDGTLTVGGSVQFSALTSCTSLQTNGSGVLSCGSSGGVTTVATFSGSSQANGASISGGNITFGPADGTNPGMVSTGTQTFAGQKTFSGSRVIFQGATASDEANGNLISLSGTLSSTSYNQSGLRVNAAVSPGSAATRLYSALAFNAVSDSNNVTNAALAGLFGGTYYYGTGTVGTVYGGYFQNQLDAAGTITKGIGVYVDDAYESAGNFTNNVGVAINEQTKGTNNTNLLIGTDTPAAGSYSIYNSSSRTNYFHGVIQNDASGTNYFSGKLGVGTTSSASIKLHVSGTTEQLRLEYDSGDYTSFTVNSSGDLTVAPSGGDVSVAGNLSITGQVTISGTNISAPNNLNIDSNTFFIDTTSNRIGIGTTSIADSAVTISLAADADSIYGSALMLNGQMTSTSYNQTGIWANPTVAVSGASTQSYTGLLGMPYTTEASDLSGGFLVGAAGQPFYDGSGTLGTAIGLGAQVWNGSGTISAARGIYVSNPSNDGTISNNIGIYIENQTQGAGAEDYGLYIQGSDGYAIFVDAGASRFDGLVRVGGGGTNSVATGNGELYVQNDLEVDGAAVFTTVSGAGLSDCDNATTSKLLWDSGTNTFSCGTDQSGGGGGSEWTDGGTFLYPSDSSGAEDIVIGGISTGAADIWLQATGAAIFNEQGAAVNFRVESDTNANMLLVDGANNRIGIGNASPVSIMQIGEYNENAPSLTFGSDAFADVYGISSFNNHLRLWAPEGIHIIQSYTDTIIATINSSGMALAGQLTIGTSNTTGTLLVLDTKTNSGDPTGVDGAMYYNSSYGGLRCYIKGEWGFCNQALSPAWGYDIRDDFMGLSNWAPGGSGGESIGELPWVFYNWGNGTNVGKAEATDAGRPGMYYFSTGSDTFGQASILLGNYAGSGGEDVIIDGGMEIEFAINIPTLANGTNDFEVRMGLCDDPQASGCVDGLYFEYDRDSSANWRMGASNNSSRTETNSSVAVTAGWHRFRIKVNSSVTSVEYFVDGTSLGTVTTNIPTSRTTTPGFTIVKEAGTSARFMYIDYFWMHNKFTTPR